MASHVFQVRMRLDIFRANAATDLLRATHAKGLAFDMSFP